MITLRTIEGVPLSFVVVVILFFGEEKGQLIALGGERFQLFLHGQIIKLDLLNMID